jgi:hypothetical protein
MFRTSKTVAYVVILIALTAAFAFAASTSAAPADKEIKASLDKAPKAVFLQTKYEFSPVFEGHEIKHDFIVENTGQAPLVIKSIRPD